jgi:hypothetical protein
MNAETRLLDTQIRMAMAVSALMIAHQVAGKAARDGIFLSQFSTTALPKIVVAAALVAVISSILRGRTRAGPLQVTVLSLAASGVLQAGEWLLLQFHPRLAACVIYLHVVGFGAILLSGFWSVLSEHFDPRVAKRVFGRINGMGNLGGLAGGLMAERVAAWMSTSGVVLALAILHLTCAFVLWRGFRRASPPETHPPPPENPTVKETGRRYPFLLTLAGLVLATSTSAALLDFVFKAQATATLGKGEALVRFFGVFYTATNFLTFLVQTFVVRFALQFGGLAASASALPVTAAAGGLTALLIPGFGVFNGVRGIEVVVRGSLFRSAYELFYTAVAPTDKRVAKSLIDVGVNRMGDALGAGLVQLFLVFAPGRYTGILVSACACSVAAFLLGLHLRRGYILALEKSLVDRGFELDPSLVEDSTTYSVLMQTLALRGSTGSSRDQATMPSRLLATPPRNDPFVRCATELRSGDAGRVVDTLQKLGPEDWMLAPLVIKLLAWDSVTQTARDALKRMAPKIVGLLIDILLDPDRDFAIRRRVPRVLALVPSPRAVEGLLAALNDQRFEVRFYSARALYLLLRDHSELSVPQERVWATVNRELSLQKSVWQSHRLLDSRDIGDADWFFDEQLQDRADRNLEHIFTLLGLLLPAEAVRTAFRALHTDDRYLKGTAFEYLETATPPDTRRPLLQVLEADAEYRAVAPDSNDALARLLQSQAQIDLSLRSVPRVVDPGMRYTR